MTDSQNSQILNHLMTCGTLTPMDALNLFGCFRLSARVRELKDKGFNIKTEMVVIGEKKVAKYSMI
jgi:hypothetical protein